MFYVHCLVHGQKNNTLQWEASTYQRLELIFPWAGSIHIRSTQNQTITAVYQSEGEYQEHLFLSSLSEDNTLILSETTHPLGVGFNDKLSAHKVMSSTVSLSLPQNILVDIQAKNAAMEVSGTFTAAAIFLEEGTLLLHCPSLVGKITTRSANVEWYGLQHDFVAKSKYGKVIGPSLSNDSPPVSIESTWGNITVYSHRN